MAGEKKKYNVRTKPSGFGDTFKGLAKILGISKAGAATNSSGNRTYSPNQQPMQNIRRTK